MKKGMKIAWQLEDSTEVSKVTFQSTRKPRLSDDPLFRAISKEFDNEDMTDAEQMKAFRALRRAGLLNLMATLSLNAEQTLKHAET